MIGIKFQPTALYRMFGLDMSQVTDDVRPFEEVLSTEVSRLQKIAPQLMDHESTLSEIDTWLSEVSVSDDSATVSNALELLFRKRGMIGVKELAEASGVTERQLERLFLKQVGLSPKFYSRVIRFSHIFALIEEGDYSWAQVAFKSGFTDQSHFIKNFKEFTGEDPSKYLFEDENMANFFMRKDL